MDNKLRILFVGLSLKVGGIERALVEQVNALSLEGHDVDLFLFYRGGEFLQNVSSQVRILSGNFLLSSMAMTNKEAHRDIIHFVFRTIMYVLSKWIGNRRLYSLVFRFMPKLDGYDVAVSYFHDSAAKGLYYGCNLFVLDRVNALKKVAWIHSDPLLIHADSNDNRQLYKCFDAVVNVSYAMKRRFDVLGVIEPERSLVVYNRYNEALIKREANERAFSLSDTINIVTVGRLERYKGTMELLDIAHRLKDGGHDFTWYFIGTGCQQEEAEKFVINNELSDKVLFIGQVANPYPFIQMADLLVSGSFSETFGLGILEALLLNTPVIAYQYEAINEVIMNGKNGIIVDSFATLFLIMSDLLSNEQKIKELKTHSRPIINYNSRNYEQMREVL